MKKRAMKKYIPYGNYCYGKIKRLLPNGIGFKTTRKCKNLIKYKQIDDSITIPKEMGSNETIEVPVKRWIYKCRYMNVTTEDDALLYDNCKICGAKEPQENYDYMDL